ncbi:hypothetical protein SESBI_10641 [Sesbania bispinosa]|nr:hypothetical protein SESBI_10641 [Sesbania bispinosa]
MDNRKASSSCGVVSGIKWVVAAMNDDESDVVAYSSGWNDNEMMCSGVLATRRMEMASYSTSYNNSIRSVPDTVWGVEMDEHKGSFAGNGWLKHVWLFQSKLS